MTRLAPFLSGIDLKLPDRRCSLKLSIHRLAFPGILAFFAVSLGAQNLSSSEIVTALKRGGYVIVMRHASSPREVPTKATANPDNTTPERQLDETGRKTAIAMGKAIRDLKIPLGDVYSSPTYRALETARLEQWMNVMPVPELGDGGQSMQGVSESQGAWLQKQVSQSPKSGTNTVLITHMPNLSRAFPNVTGVSDGESLVFRPDGRGAATLVGRIKIEEWPNLHP